MAFPGSNAKTDRPHGSPPPRKTKEGSIAGEADRGHGLQANSPHRRWIGYPKGRDPFRPDFRMLADASGRLQPSGHCGSGGEPDPIASSVPKGGSAIDGRAGG